VRADDADPTVDRPQDGFPPGFGQGAAERDAALLLRCLLGTTPRDLHALVWREGSASAAVRAIERGVAGSANDRAFLRDAEPDRLRAAIASAGARLVTPGDAEYAAALARLRDPPVALFLRGRPLVPTQRRVAVVGSRRPTVLGADVAWELGRGLAMAGVVVVSGGAIGIDARSHEGALAVGGTTVCVLGSGIDVLYPATNRAVLEEIAERGTLVTEYPPGVPAEPFRFPARNRVIAALSLGVVIVQGSARSGTRSTADYASQVGIEVFAVPGPVTSALSEAPHALIRDGARLITGAGDLLDDLGLEPVDLSIALDGLSPAQRSVLDALRSPMLPEQVASASSLATADAVAALVQLEMLGVVTCAGGRYERAAAALRPDAVADTR
jgi:DNA processing protein